MSKLAVIGITLIATPIAIAESIMIIQELGIGGAALVGTVIAGVIILFISLLPT